MMKQLIKIIHLIILLLTIVTISSSAQNLNDSLSVRRIIKLEEVVAALDKNPALLAFDEQIKSYKAYAGAAKSLDPPKVSAGLWMFPYRRPESMNGVEPEDKGSIMIGVEQMIMNPGKRNAEQKYMEGMSEVEQTMKAKDRQDMIEEAKKMYYEWIILLKKYNVLKESESIINLMIRSGEIGYTYNQNQLNRIYKAKSELYNIKTMQLMLEGEMKQMNIGLNTMMNADKDFIFEPDTNYTVAAYDILPADSATVASARSDIRYLNESIRLFELKNDFELSQRKPDFGIQYAHMKNLGTMPSQFNLMGMITIPVAPWSAKKYKANLQGIKYETEVLNLRKKAVMNEAIGKLEELRSKIASKKKQLQLYEQHLLPALQKNFSTSLIAFEHMKEDMFMTIDALMAVRMARTEYLNLTGELLKLQAEYERQIEKQ
jgi:outer membrane protein, heavy metal efflux system